MNDFTLKGLDSFDYEYIDNDDKIHNDDNDDDEDKIENTRWIISPWKDLTPLTPLDFHSAPLANPVAVIINY